MRAALAFLLLARAAAFAQGIDVRELPPLPEVPLDDAQSGAVAMVAASEAGEDVVVGAAKREQSLGTVASAVTVISGDRLRRFGYRTVSEALRSACGLFVVDDRMSERLGIRGLQILGDFNTRVLVLIDGATLNEPWNQFAGIGQDLPLAIDDVERIEIVRGPVSSLYGTNAFFGIVNIVTRQAGRAPRLYGRVGGGTLGTGTASAGFALGTPDRQLRGSVAAALRGGETLDIDRVGETGADGATALAASLVGHLGGAFAQLRAYRKLRELAGAPYGTVPGDDTNRNVDQMILAEGGYTREVGPVTLTGRAYLGRYRFQDFLAYEGAPEFRDIGDSAWLGAEARARVGLGPIGVTAGGEVSYADVESRSFDDGDEAGGTRIPTTFDQQGLYAELDAAPLSFLALTAGVRFDRNSRFDENASPRAALLLHTADRLGLKLLYAHGFRNPSPFEAFFEDGMQFVANPALDAERITSYEAVVWARPVPGLNLRLSGFLWDLADLIEQRDIGGGMLQGQNIVSMRSTGLELEATYRHSGGTIAFATAALTVVERDGAAELATNAPRVTATAGASTPPLFGRLHLSTELAVIGARRTRDPTRDAGPFVGWNVAAHVPAWRGLDVTVGARNLLGAREEVPAQSDYDRGGDALTVLPGEGREIYARVGASL